MTKRIQLPNNHYALVDDEDYERVINSGYNWRTKKGGNALYACATTYINDWGNKKVAVVLMHRFILNAKPNQEVDHKNGDGLDNRKENIRIATRSQNQANRGLFKNNKTGYKCVWFEKKRGLYRARLRFCGKSYSLGYYDNPIDAARAYNEAALKICGSFARLNHI